MYVPGVSHQQLGRPDCNQSTDHKQHLTEARPAEDLREDTLEERHPESRQRERESNESLRFDTRPALTHSAFTVRLMLKYVET